MKAIVNTRYGSPQVLSLQDVEKPTINDDQLLLKVHAASVNPYDWHHMRGKPLFMRMMTGLRKPKHTILGSDVAGEVIEVGANVTDFKPGDTVFGAVGMGGFAEYAVGSAKSIVHKPESITYAEAAAIPIAAITALQCLRDTGEIKRGQRVLINGASGGVGTYAVQIAKAFGAEVTGVCSTRNLDMGLSIGADHVVDYTKEDFTRSGIQYDLVLDTVGNRSIGALKRALCPQGICVTIGYSMSLFFQLMLRKRWLTKPGQKQVKSMLARISRDDLEQINSLIESGQVKSVIDREYSFQQLPAAIAYIEEGHARGKVVVNVTS